MTAVCYWRKALGNLPYRQPGDSASLAFPMLAAAEKGAEAVKERLVDGGGT